MMRCNPDAVANPDLGTINMRRFLPSFLRRKPKAADPKVDISQIDHAIFETRVFERLSPLEVKFLYDFRREVTKQTHLGITLPSVPIQSRIKSIKTVLTKQIDAKASSLTPIASDMSSSNEAQLSKRVVFRLQLCNDYFSMLSDLGLKSELELTPITQGNKLLYLFDAVLLGTSSERVEEHMKLFGPRFYQDTMKSAFYPLYEAELKTISRIQTQHFPMQAKKHQKIATNLVSTYLLDTLELNTKIRMVLAYIDPNYGGFKPLPDDHNMPLPDVIRGRQEFFPEGNRIAQEYLLAVKKQIQDAENTVLEDRETIRYGVYFFFATCILDGIVCSI